MQINNKTITQGKINLELIIDLLDKITTINQSIKSDGIVIYATNTQGEKVPKQNPAITSYLALVAELRYQCSEAGISKASSRKIAKAAADTKSIKVTTSLKEKLLNSDSADDAIMKFFNID